MNKGSFLELLDDFSEWWKDKKKAEANIERGTNVNFSLNEYGDACVDVLFDADTENKDALASLLYLICTGKVSGIILQKLSDKYGQDFMTDIYSRMANLHASESDDDDDSDSEYFMNQPVIKPSEVFNEV